MFDNTTPADEPKVYFGIEFPPTQPEEVVGVIDGKDSYQEAVIENIFQELSKLEESKRQDAATVEISLGFVLEDGPNAELDWLIRYIELAVMNELRRKEILDYKEVSRPMGDNEAFKESVLIITCLPHKFLEWYGTKELGLKGTGDVMAFYRELAQALNSITAAIFYSQIVKWYEDEAKDLDGYIQKSKDDIKEATTLTRDEQDNARAKLDGDWLDVQPGKHGLQADRYKPLKPITIDRKAAEALKQSSAVRSEKVSKFDELYAELDAIRESIYENPTRKLQKYENKITGELPPMDGSDSSAFSKMGDRLWNIKGFERYNGDEQAMLKDHAQLKVDRKSLEQKKEEIRKLRLEIQGK